MAVDPNQADWRYITGVISLGYPAMFWLVVWLIKKTFLLSERSITAVAKNSEVLDEVIRLIRDK